MRFKSEETLHYIIDDRNDFEPWLAFKDTTTVNRKSCAHICAYLAFKRDLTLVAMGHRLVNTNNFWTRHVSIMFVIIHFLKTLCLHDEKLSHTLFYSIPLNPANSLKIQWLEIRQKSQLFNLKKVKCLQNVHHVSGKPPKLQIETIFHKDTHTVIQILFGTSFFWI